MENKSQHLLGVFWLRRGDRTKIFSVSHDPVLYHGGRDVSRIESCHGDDAGVVKQRSRARIGIETRAAEHISIREEVAGFLASVAPCGDVLMRSRCVPNSSLIGGFSITLMSSTLR